MTRRIDTLEADYFDGLYRGDLDPWRFRTSDYEKGKYAATLRALSRPRYRSALEAGCSIGVFTRALKKRCDHVLAVDLSSIALDAARRESEGVDGLEFRQAALPSEFPDGRFDLIVLSEMLYYLSAKDLDAMAACCLAALENDGEVALCHWIGDTDYPLSGDEAAGLFIAATASRWRVRFQRREPAFRLEVLGR